MPAAAVIPASLAYTNVAAVKKLVVETLRGQVRNVPVDVSGASARILRCALTRVFGGSNPGSRLLFHELPPLARVT